MNITITGKELKATEAIKEYVEKKIEKLTKYFGEDYDVSVTITTQKSEQIALMQVIAANSTYRAETSHRDLYASIDKDVDILEGQIRKLKTKKERMNKEASIKEKQEAGTAFYTVENEIIKTIYYDIKPMTPEDAKLSLSAKLTDIFLTFINIETGKVNVVYRLKDGKNFGLVEPM